jgi:hypothetical protein
VIFENWGGGVICKNTGHGWPNYSSATALHIVKKSVTVYIFTFSKKFYLARVLILGILQLFLFKHGFAK